MAIHFRAARTKTVNRARKSNLFREILAARRVYLFILPTFAFLIIFAYYPVLSALFHAFFDWDGFNKSFIGFSNFRQMFAVDRAFIRSLGNISRLTIARLAIAVTFPLLAAELIFNLRDSNVAYMWRIGFVVPMVIPWMVQVLVWKFIYEPQLGVLNSLLRAVGLDAWTQTWLGDSKLALWCIVFFRFPWIAGFNLLIYLAGLDSIPLEIFDAAAIDGASRLRRMLSIDFPMIMGQIKLIVVMTTISQLQDFQDVMIFTDGGPGQATYVPGLVLYRSAFVYNKMGYASAIGLFLFICVMIVTLLNMRFIHSSTEYMPES